MLWKSLSQQLSHCSECFCHQETVLQSCWFINSLQVITEAICLSVSLSHIQKTVLKSRRAAKSCFVSWNLCFVVAKKSKFRRSLSLTNTIQFSQNGLYLQSGLILIWSNNCVLINSDYNWLQLLKFLGIPVWIPLYFLDIPTPLQRHWHCEKRLPLF